MDLNTTKDVATTVAAILASIKVIVDLVEKWKNAPPPGKHRKR
ncbi:hypothetical protein [Pelosinus propionicus]|nr:hypothetical protein [Pelosinus propionicus]